MSNPRGKRPASKTADSGAGVSSRKGASAAGRRATSAAGARAEEPTGFAFGPVNYVLFGAAAAAIVAGYALLDRGSVTAAPILLVVGYILLIPAALLAGLSRRRRRSTPDV